MRLGGARILNGAPDTFRRRRHFDMAHTEFAQGVDDGVDGHAKRGDRAAFAGRADAERVR